jgi:hypothetical protein
MPTLIFWLIAVVMIIGFIKTNPVIGWTLATAFLFWWFYKQPVRIGFAVIFVNLYLFKAYPVAGFVMLALLIAVAFYGYKKTPTQNPNSKTMAGVATAATAFVAADVLTSSTPTSDIDVGGFDF